MAGSDPSEARLNRRLFIVGTASGGQEVNPNIQGQAHTRAIRGDLDALERLEDQQRLGGGMVLVEGRSVMMSYLATFTIGSSESSSSAGTVTFQLKLTCGEDYPARPPSVDWMDCPLELKANIEHVLSTPNSNAKPHLADVLSGLKNAITDHETTKRASNRKKIPEKASKGKKPSNGDGKD